MKNCCKKYYVHFILVGLVAVVGGIAAYFYIDQFGSNDFSKKSEDWANFATYISGTVGVAAVVATLIAFVITLRQQQKLIDSQDEMLKKQDEQIEQIEEQLKNEKESRGVEFAYQSSLNVFPYLITTVKSKFREELNYYDTDSRSLKLALKSPGGKASHVDLKEGSIFFSYTVIDNILARLQNFHDYKGTSFYPYDYSVRPDLGFYKYKSKYIFESMIELHFWYLNAAHDFAFEDFSLSVHKIFKEVRAAALFAEKNINKSEDLKGYYESFFDDVDQFSLMDSIFSTRRLNFKFILLCYHSFNLGCGFDAEFGKASDVLGLPRKPEDLYMLVLSNAPIMYPKVFEKWYELGVFIKDKVPAEKQASN